MSAPLPYYKRYPRDLFDGTVGMPLEIKGAYGLLLDLIYMQPGALRDDPHYIAGHLGCSVRRWNSIRKELVGLGKIVCESGIISNSRADKERIIRSKYQENQRENRLGSKENNGLTESTVPPARGKISDTDIRASSSLRSEESARKPTASSWPPSCPDSVKPGGKEDLFGELEPDRKRPPAIRNRFANGDFEQWWSAYPHKVGKADARKAFERVGKSRDGPTLETLVAGVRRYRETKPPDRSWCNPATWLNQERWNDEPADNQIASPQRGQRAGDGTNFIAGLDAAIRLRAGMAGRATGDDQSGDERGRTIDGDFLRR